jgi:hypothetical protein
MSRNLVQLIKDLQNHIQMLRNDQNATKDDILGDMETRLVEVYHRIVTTPSVFNYVLPIDEYDNNDVFLRQNAYVASEV